MNNTQTSFIGSPIWYGVLVQEENTTTPGLGGLTPQKTGQITRRLAQSFHLYPP